MQRINIYIPEELNEQLEFSAKSRRKAKAVIIREAIGEGLKVVRPKSVSATALVNLAKMAKQVPTHGKVPKDFIKNLDYYTWGGKKRGQ